MKTRIIKTTIIAVFLIGVAILNDMSNASDIKFLNYLVKDPHAKELDTFDELFNDRIRDLCVTGHSYSIIASICVCALWHTWWSGNSNASSVKE